MEHDGDAGTGAEGFWYPSDGVMFESLLGETRFYKHAAQKVIDALRNQGVDITLAGDLCSRTPCVVQQIIHDNHEPFLAEESSYVEWSQCDPPPKLGVWAGPEHMIGVRLQVFGDDTWQQVVCDPGQFEAGSSAPKRRRTDRNTAKTITIQPKTRYCVELVAKEPFEMTEGFDARNNVSPQPAGVKDVLAFLPTIDGFTVEAFFERCDVTIQQGGPWPAFKEIVVAAHFVFPLLMRPTVRVFADKSCDKLFPYNSTVDDAASARVDHNAWIEWLTKKEMDYERVVQKMLIMSSNEFLTFAPFHDMRDLWYNKFGNKLFPGMSTVDDLDDFNPGAVSLSMVKEYYNNLNSGYVYHLYINMNKLTEAKKEHDLGEGLWPMFQMVAIPPKVSFPIFQGMTTLDASPVLAEDEEGDEVLFEEIEQPMEPLEDEEEDDEEDGGTDQIEKAKARKYWHPTEELNQKAVCVFLQKIYNEVKEDGGDIDDMNKRWTNYDDYVKNSIKSALQLDSCNDVVLRWCKKILVVLIEHKRFTVGHIKAFGLGKAWDFKLDADNNKVNDKTTRTREEVMKDAHKAAKAVLRGSSGKGAVQEEVVPKEPLHRSGGKLEALSSDGIAQLKKVIADELKKKSTEMTTPSLTESTAALMIEKFEEMVQLVNNIPTLVKSKVDESFKEVRKEMEDVKAENDILRLSLGTCIKTEEAFQNLFNIMSMKYHSTEDQIDFIKKIKKHLHGGAKAAANSTLDELEAELQSERSGK